MMTHTTASHLILRIHAFKFLANAWGQSVPVHMVVMPDLRIEVQEEKQVNPLTSYHR